MIVRFGGGNDGIAEYLVTGRKADREFTRDQLDQRVIISGDLALTNKIIHSISDKGQQRYLHISLSFAENEVSTETLTAVTEEYKKLLMNAWHEDEFNFYAEAHIPKIKNIVDNKTGKLVERKPHLHLVIPRVNLISGNVLNPVGDLTKKSSQEQIDAIQEHINNRFSLISPKDVPRDSDENKAKVLSRIKGDFYRERHAVKKEEILKKIESENITTIRQFSELIKQYGETKIRNQGKNNEYFAVKFKGDKKFTNLKSPVFSKSYIENRFLPIIKPSESQITNRLNTWLTKTSYEIRFIWSASKKVRDIYKSLNEDQKIAFLQERKTSYERKYNIKSGNTLRTGRWQASYQRSTEPVAGRYQITQAIGVPRLPARGLAYGIPGNRSAEFNGILPDNEKRDLAKYVPERKHSGGNVRRNDEQWRRRGIKQAAESTVLHESMYQWENKQAHDNDNELFNEIKRDIDPQRFLSEMQRRFYINTEAHKLTYGYDNSPRFSAGNRNLNASDFLTKHIHLSWHEAKIVLTEIWQAQKENTPFDKPVIKVQLNNYESRRRLNSIKNSTQFLRDCLKDEKIKLFNEIRSMRKQLYKTATEMHTDPELVKGLIVYKKLSALELLNHRATEAKNAITQYHYNWTKGKDTMKAIDNLKKALFNEDENCISADEPTLSLKEAIEANKKRQQFVAGNLNMKQLIIRNRSKKIEYISPHTEKPVFTDAGIYLLLNKKPEKDEVALALEYAKEKFGGVLKLRGSEDFKKRCAEVAAEKNMNIILRPVKYNDLMKEIKSTLQEQQKENAIEQGDLQQQAATPASLPQAAPQQQTTADQPAAGAAQQSAQSVIPAAVPGAVKSVRTQWDSNFPDVVLHGRLGDATAHPDYEAAKAGDKASAMRLLKETLSPDAISQMHNIIGDKEVILLAVHAEESAGKNKIPQVMARTLGGILNQEVDEEIVQASNVSRTQQDGFGRLVNQPQFSGEVRTDKPYFLLDDTLTQGGTLASLKGYIESQGGKVTGISALTGKQYSSKISLLPETLDKLRQQYQSTDLETWWETQYGYGFDKLTESEANYLIRAQDAERIRDKCLEAGQKGNQPVVRGNAENNGSVSSENLVTPTGVVTASQQPEQHATQSQSVRQQPPGAASTAAQQQAETTPQSAMAYASEEMPQEAEKWLDVPFSRKDEAKMLGAKWSMERKLWYVPAGEDTQPFREFFLENQPERQNIDPREEFAMALKDAGLIVKGLPEMDGNLYRVPVEGAKSGKKDGAYIAHADGHPAGWIQNFKTGHTEKWKASGKYMESVAQSTSEMNARKKAAELNREIAYNKKSREITEKFEQLPDAPADHPYLKAKKLDQNGNAFGAKLDEKGNLLLPLKDIDGKIWSVQKISENGFKQYEKGGKVAGHFMIIGDESKVISNDVIISTGFGTSAAIHAATGSPVIASFQDSSLKDVANSFRELYPEKRIIIMGDDDRHNEEKGIKNSGREKATQAADAVGGIAIFPRFAATEKGREFTDFADLYRVHGEEAVRSQLQAALEQEVITETTEITKTTVTVQNQQDDEQEM